MQPTESHVGAPAPVMIGEAVRTMGRCDVNLNDDEIGRVVQVELLHVLVLNVDIILVSKISGESCQTERRKQRVFDRTPERALRLRERGQNHLDLQLPALPEDENRDLEYFPAIELGQEHALPVAELMVAVDHV